MPDDAVLVPGDAAGSRSETSAGAARPDSYDLFVSYAPADRPWVDGYLLPALSLPAEKVITKDDFRPGMPVVEEFERAVASSRHTLLVLTPAYLADEWSRFADQLACAVAAMGAGDRLVPLLLQRCRPPLHIDARVALDLTDSSRWEPECARLRELLDRPAPPAQKIPCPYPGMVPFRPEDASFFYGREDEIGELLRRLRHQSLLFVIGPSGSGKSSLVFAGLLPRLEESGHFSRGSWLVRTLRPGARGREALAEALATPPESPGAVSARATGLGAVAGDAVNDRVTRLLAANSPSERLLLVIDQFEEIFALSGREEQRRFVAALEDLRRTERCTLLILMRADFYPDLMHSDLWPVDPSQRLEIAPLAGPELREAIDRPAAALGVYLEPALLERLAADAADEPGVLPLLQETMRLLWAERRRRYLPLSAYDKLERDGRSGLAVAVAAKADATFVELTQTQQQIARRVFLALVQFGQGRSDTRRRQPLEELRLLATAERDDFDRTLDHLTRNRLLILSGEESGQGPLVDLSHEALITGWPRLIRWLQEDRAGLLVHRRLTEAAAEWHDRGRDTSFLVGGVALAEALGYARGHPAEISTEERDFLAASSAREAARERTAYLGQAAGCGVGAALGFSLAFGIGYAQSELSRWFLITMLVMFPVGGLVGFIVGLQLWLFRRNPVWRVAAAAIGGALAGGVAYSLFLWLGLRPEDLTAAHVVVGVLLGMGLGLGASLARSVDERLLTTAAGGLAGMVLAWATGGVSWHVVQVLVAGVVLGGLTSLGLWATAVRQPRGSTPPEGARP